MKTFLSIGGLSAGVIFGLASCNPWADGILVYENKSAEFMNEVHGMPFGDGCESIYYYSRAGGLQDLTVLSKFSCESGKVDQVVADIIKWNDAQIGRERSRETLGSASHSLRLPEDETTKLKWWDFDSQKIAKASICREGFGCSLWVAEAVGGRVEVYMYQKP